MNTQTQVNTYSKLAQRGDALVSSSRIEEALNLLKPLMLNVDTLNGASLYRAMSQLQKAYPDLNGHEIEALATAVMRTLQNRRQHLG